MEGSLNNRERRRYPRIVVNLTIEYREMHDSWLRGATLVNASEGGFLIEAARDIPVGMELSITVLYPMGCELANFKVVAKIVRKEPYSKGNQYWEGYQYGLEFIKISEEDRWKLDLLLSGRYYLEEMHTINDVYPHKETEF